MKRFMSIKDTATYSGLSQFYIRNRCKNGTIPHRMMGKKYMVDYKALANKPSLKITEPTKPIKTANKTYIMLFSPFS